MSLNSDPMQRNKPIIRDADSQRSRITTNEPYGFNLPASSSHPLPNIRPSPIPGNFNIVPQPPPLLPPQTSVLSDALTPFNKERLLDVLQQGLGAYVFIEHYGLVPKLNHF